MKSVLSAAAVVAALFSVTTAQARSVAKTELGEQAAYATWDQYNPNGESTYVSLVVGNGTSVKYAAISIFRVDAEGNVLFSGFGVTDTYTFSSNSGLTQATVSGTVDFFNEVWGEIVPLTFNVTFNKTGTIDVNNSVHHHHDKASGGMVHVHFKGASRAATASGTISNGTENFIANLPLVPSMTFMSHSSTTTMMVGSLVISTPGN